MRAVRFSCSQLDQPLLLRDHRVDPLVSRSREVGDGPLLLVSRGNRDPQALELSRRYASTVMPPDAIAWILASGRLAVGGVAQESCVGMRTDGLKTIRSPPQQASALVRLATDLPIFLERLSREQRTECRRVGAPRCTRWPSLGQRMIGSPRAREVVLGVDIRRTGCTECPSATVVGPFVPRCPLNNLPMSAELPNCPVRRNLRPPCASA